MPVEYFEYYTLIEPFAEGYYKLGKKQKARQLLDKLIKKYHESLTFYNGLSVADQNDLRVDIYTAMERYRNLLWIMKDQGDLEYYNKAKPVFNGFNKRFARFEWDNE